MRSIQPRLAQSRGEKGTALDLLHRVRNVIASDGRGPRLGRGLGQGRRRGKAGRGIPGGIVKNGPHSAQTIDGEFADLAPQPPGRHGDGRHHGDQEQPSGRMPFDQAEFNCGIAPTAGQDQEQRRNEHCASRRR